MGLILRNTDRWRTWKNGYVRFFWFDATHRTTRGDERTMTVTVHLFYWRAFQLNLVHTYDEPGDFHFTIGTTPIHLLSKKRK